MFKLSPIIMTDCRQMILEANWIVSAQMLQKEDPFKFMVPNPRIKMTPVQDGNDVELYQTNSIGNVNFVVNSQNQYHLPTIVVF
jgi:hypothetical protein